MQPWPSCHPRYTCTHSSLLLHQTHHRRQCRPPRRLHLCRRPQPMARFYLFRLACPLPSARRQAPILLPRSRRSQNPKDPNRLGCCPTASHHRRHLSYPTRPGASPSLRPGASPSLACLRGTNLESRCCKVGQKNTKQRETIPHTNQLRSTKQPGPFIDQACCGRLSRPVLLCEQSPVPVDQIVCHLALYKKLP